MTVWLRTAEASCSSMLLYINTSPDEEDKVENPATKKASKLGRCLLSSTAA